MPLLNTRLLAHPLNWLTILLMLVIAALMGHYVSLAFSHKVSVAPNGLTYNQTETSEPNA